MPKTKKIKTETSGTAPGSCGKRGFTLLEILLALALMLIGLTVVSQLMTTSVRKAGDSEEETEIQQLCQNTINEIRAGVLPVGIGQTVSLPEHPGWVVQVTFENAILPNLVNISVVAQKYQQLRKSNSTDNLTGNSTATIALPIAGRRLVFKEWVRRNMLKSALPTDESSGSINSSTEFMPNSEFNTELLPNRFMSNPTLNSDPFAEVGLPLK